MNAYRNVSSNFRPLFGVAAIGLTAVTLSLAVVLPALHQPAREEGQMLVASPAYAPTEAVIIPARIEVIASRPAGATAFEQVRHTAQPTVSKQAS